MRRHPEGPGPRFRRPRTRTAGAVAGLATALALVLTACGSPAPAATSTEPGGLNGTDISDVVARPALALTDTEGKPFDLRQRPPGELTVVYFGYTRCPDLCPTAMADLAAARRQLVAADRARLQVVFVTEDPATDTAPVMRRWLDKFDTATIGLTGGDEATERVLDAIKAPRTVVVPSPEAGVATPSTGVTVQHTNSVYAFEGDRTVVYTDRTSPVDYASDFHTLLTS